MTLYKLAYSSELGRVSEHLAVKDIEINDDLKVTKEPLPKGRYLYRFMVRDVFGNTIRSDELKPLNWDGKTVTFPKDDNAGQE